MCRATALGFGTKANNKPSVQCMKVGTSFSTSLSVYNIP